MTTKSLNLILQSLKDSNFLKGVGVVRNGNISYEPFLLENGVKLREQLLKRLLKNCNSNWSTQCGDVRRIDEKPKASDDHRSILQRIEFQKSLYHIYDEKLINSTNSIAWKLMYDENGSHFVSKDDLFYGSDLKNMLVTDYFVAAENDLIRYNNLQRERKVWWMKYSANPSRYWIEPSQLKSANDYDEISQNSKSMSVKAKFAYGPAEVENIYLIPLYKSALFAGQFGKISLIRSIINLDLAASALILDSSVFRSGTDCENFTLMLNRKLAPYQVLLANLHDRNATVDELTLHLQHVINRSGLRLYDNSVHTNHQMELEGKLLQFDTLGIPYVLLIDDESTKNGFIRLRSRDTTLFETIHISDIPNYLLNIFGHR